MSLEAWDEQAEPSPGGTAASSTRTQPRSRTLARRKTPRRPQGMGQEGGSRARPAPNQPWEPAGTGGPAATPRTSSIATVPGSPMFPACGML